MHYEVKSTFLIIKLASKTDIILCFNLIEQNILFRFHAWSEVSLWPLVLRLGKLGVGAQDRNSAKSSLLVRFPPI